MNPLRLALLVLVSLGASYLVIYFTYQLKTTLQTGVVRTTHGGIHRRIQPRGYWLFVCWIIVLIIMLLAFLLLAALIALGRLQL